jgi:hypothetical protein
VCLLCLRLNLLFDLIRRRQKPTLYALSGLEKVQKHPFFSPKKSPANFSWAFYFLSDFATTSK